MPRQDFQPVGTYSKERDLGANGISEPSASSGSHGQREARKSAPSRALRQRRCAGPTTTLARLSRNSAGQNVIGAWPQPLDPLRAMPGPCGDLSDSAAPHSRRTQPSCDPQRILLGKISLSASFHAVAALKKLLRFRRTQPPSHFGKTVARPKPSPAQIKSTVTATPATFAHLPFTCSPMTS
jgi:hypothetical protein